MRTARQVKPGEQLLPGTKIEWEKGISAIMCHVRSNRESPGYVLLANGDMVYENDFRIPNQSVSGASVNFTKGQSHEEARSLRQKRQKKAALRARLYKIKERHQALIAEGRISGPKEN